MNKHFDVIVIGSGPGGYVAAAECAKLGFKTACVEKYNDVGGTCLNVGCIPSKTLLHTSQMYEYIKKNGELEGIKAEEVVCDFPKMMERKREVVKSLVQSVNSILTANKVEFIKGQATFVDPHTIQIKNDHSITLTADYFILATGSKPIQIPFLPFDKKTIVSSTEVLSLKKIPQSMVVIGGGVIGVELASVYRRLGTNVTIVEMLDRICPTMDESISRALLQILKKQGLNFHLQAKVLNGKAHNDYAIIEVEMNQKKLELKSEILLVAVGRKPYFEGLGLEKINVNKTEKGTIAINDSFQTSQRHIFAIGDLIDGPMLAHKASDEGVAVAHLLKGKKIEVDYLAIPNVIYTHPEVATVGLTEKQAKTFNLNVKVGQAYFKGNARAKCINDTDGFVKVVVEETNHKLLGLHILGANASELIAIGVIGIKNRMNFEDIVNSSFAHPTLSESIKDALHTINFK